MSIKLILFDLGGVVFDRFNRKQFARDIQSDIPPEEFGKYLYTENYFEKFEKVPSTKEEYAEYIKDLTKSPLDISEIIYMYKKNLGNINLSSYKAFKEFKDMGIKVGILSNISSFWASEIDEVIKNLDVDYKFYSYEIGCVKPFDDIYQYVLENVPFEASEIVFLDDNLDNVNGAKRNKIKAYQVKFNNMYEVLSVIKNYTK